jgi:2'-5' RNA ligase
MSKTGSRQTSLFSTYAPVTYQQYVLAICPDDGVANDLSYIQKKVSESIGQSVKERVTHITLTSFFADISEEEQVVYEIKNTIKGKIKPSFIWLDNYGCQPSLGTIYIRSKPSQYFKSIQQMLYPCLFLCSAIQKNRKIYFSTEHYIPIIKSSGKKKITDYWPNFKDRKYENKFIADSIVLFRRDSVEDVYVRVGEVKL